MIEREEVSDRTIRCSLKRLFNQCTLSGRIMKIGILLFCFCCNFCNCLSQTPGSGWQRQQSGLTCKINDVVIIDSLRFICAGDTNITLITSNGGITWLQLIAPDTRARSLDVTNSVSVFLHAPFAIYETTNIGLSWSYVNTPPDIYNIDFIDPQTGFACGVDFSPVPVVFRTYDRGLNWSRYFTNGLGSAGKIKMFNSDSGRIVVNSRILQITTSGGVSWFSSTGQPTHEIAAIYSFNIHEHYAAGNSGSASRTTNMGSSWIGLDPGTRLNIRCMTFTDSLTGYIAGDSGFISRTTDAGATWITQNSSTVFGISDIEILGNGIGVAVGDNGLILKTTSWGLTSANQNPSVIPGEYLLHQNYPNPFNPKTKVRFDIPKRSYISLKVYDINGREVNTLADEEMLPGEYEIEYDGRDNPSGIYFCVLRTDTGIRNSSRKMLLVK